nr:MAG TPA: hypothetical protein [Caudoviricetes sp.]
MVKDLARSTTSPSLRFSNLIFDIMSSSPFGFIYFIIVLYDNE